MKKNMVWLGTVLVLCLSASQALACGQDGGDGGNAGNAGNAGNNAAADNNRNATKVADAKKDENQTPNAPNATEKKGLTAKVEANANGNQQNGGAGGDSCPANQ